MIDRELDFSAHALVRYIERHVDAAIVRELRERGLEDREVLAHLSATRADELQLFIKRAQRIYDNRSCAWRNTLDGLKYTLDLGHLPLVIAGGTCVTVLPANARDRLVA